MALPVLSLLSLSQRRGFNAVLSSTARISSSKNIMKNSKRCFGSATKTLVYRPFHCGEFSIDQQSRTATTGSTGTINSSSFQFSLSPTVPVNGQVTTFNSDFNSASTVTYKFGVNEEEMIADVDAPVVADADAYAGRSKVAYYRYNTPFLSAAAATGLIAWTTMLSVSLGSYCWKSSSLPLARLHCSLETSTGCRSIDTTTETVDGDAVWCLKRTFQPSIIRKKRKMGFLVRQRTVGGRRTLARRKAKGRARLGGGI